MTNKTLFSHRAERCRRVWAWLSLATVGVALLGSACRTDPLRVKTDGLDPAILPLEIQAPYTLFSERCSKCHSLARALNSSIDTNEYWDVYVERMRRQPGSGISIDDTHVILRFLYYYAAVQRQAKSSQNERLPEGARSVLK